MIGGQGIPLSVKGLSYTGGSNAIPLPAGQAMVIPAGTWQVACGIYSWMQVLDPISGLWRTVNGQTPGEARIVKSDGANVRIANLTGCAVGAVITNAGSGLTNGFGTVAVTPSAGASVWRSIVGGAINTTVTLPTFKGANYTYPPAVFFSPPPPGGIPATGKAVISAGALTGITVTNQGAGYLVAPTITFVSDPKDPNNPANPTLSVAPATPINPILSATAALTGTGTVTGLVVLDPGTPLTATPTFTFSPASTVAATAVMNYTVTGITVTAGGAAYGNAQQYILYGSAPAITTATPIYTNPAIEKGLTSPRMPVLTGPSTAGGAIQTTGLVIVDAGLGLQVSGGTMGVIAAGNSLPTTIAQATAVVGGTDDLFFLMPMDG